RVTIERITRGFECHILGQGHRQVLFRHRDYATFLAMDDRDRATPVALARNTPVAQAIVDLPLSDRTVAPRFVLQPSRDFFLRLFDGLAIEETRIDHTAFTVIGDVSDDERFRILPWRADHRDVAESVFVHKVEVALVVRRTAENGAGAVVHQNEIRYVDRQLPGRIEWMHRLDAGVEPSFSALSISAWAVPMRWHCSM